MGPRPDQVGAPSELSAVHLATLLGTDDEPFLLDVRQPEEVAAWSIPGVVNAPLGELAGRLSELPTDRRVVAVCASGSRSSRAARLLTGSGYQALNLAAWGQVYDTAVMELPRAGSSKSGAGPRAASPTWWDRGTRRSSWIPRSR